MENDKVDSKLTVTTEFEIQLRLTKGEAMALAAIAGYNIEGFLGLFYEKMGQSYLRPHEQSLRNLFSKIRSEIPNHITTIEKVYSDIEKSAQILRNKAKFKIINP